MKKFFALMLICYGCTNSPKTKENGNATADNIKESAKAVKVKKDLSFDKSKIIGIWTDGSSENATFDIREDSIYYVEQLESYKYEFYKDSIKIHYPDFTFTAKLYFSKDTLIMDSHKGDIAKFWKFKN